MGGQVPDEVKRERIERLVDLVQRIAAERNAERVGRVEEVLVEGPSRTDQALLRGGRDGTPRSTSAARLRQGTWSRCGSSTRPRRLCAGRRPPSWQPDPLSAHGDVPCAQFSAVRSKRVEARGGPDDEAAAEHGPRHFRAHGQRQVGRRRDRRGAHPRRDRLRRLDAGLPRPADSHEPAVDACPPRSDLGSRPRGVRRRVRRTGPRGHRQILAAGKTPIVVGGTGLYLRSALAGLELPPPPEPGARDRFEQLYDSIGAEHAHALLAERDAPRRAGVHPNDRRRVVRALELAEAGESLAPSHDRLWTGETRLPTVVVGLDVPKEVLKARIEERTAGCSSAAWPTRSPAPDEAALHYRPQGHRPRGDLHAPARGGNGGDYPAHAPVRGVPAKVDAARSGSRGPSCRRDTGRGRRSAGRGHDSDRYPFRGSKKIGLPASDKVRPIRPGTPFDSFGPHAKGPR